MTEAAREEPLPILRPVDQRIRSNFYLSYHHAQETPILQRDIRLYVARQYDPNEIGDLSTLNERLSPYIARLQSPHKGHTTVLIDGDGVEAPLDHATAQNAIIGFQMEWRHQLLILGAVIGQPVEIATDNFYEELYAAALRQTVKLPDEQLMAKIAEGIIDKDIHYVQHGRQNRKTEAERYESFLHSYTFAGKPAQTPELELMYGDIKKLLENEPQGTPVQRKFATLTALWEERHQKQFLLAV